LTLLQKGFAMPFLLPKKRWALTPPFQPYPKGGIFSVALSLSSRLPGVTWFFFQWSPDFPLEYSSDHRTI